MIKIYPSILSCDFSAMGQELLRMEKCGADGLHIDIMDGHFVPNITIGAPVIKSLRKVSSLPFDVHLMISDPLKYTPDFIAAGADIITFHVEADGDIDKTVEAIKNGGCVPALSIKPKTPASAVFPYLDKIGMVLVMTVEPGFGGQSFMPDMTGKLTEIRCECEKRGIVIDIQVDGGINPETIQAAAEAGANVFVAGNAVFVADDAAAVISTLKRKALQAFQSP